MYSRQSLAISFPPPGFFVMDARLVLHLDGHVIRDGGFKQGLELNVPISAGRHVLTASIDLGAIQRRRDYTIDVLEGESKSVVLRYSRFWGNFTEALDAPSTGSSGPLSFRWGRAAVAFVAVSPAALVLVFVLAVWIAPPTPEGYGLMPTGQALIALVLAPILGTGAALFFGRRRRAG